MTGGSVAGPGQLDEIPAFYGKVPSHGDFVGRRLPPAVRERLDGWLQASLLQSRQDLGADWAATWASSPLWRFVIGAGVCDARAWTGVMMPSADRVGRCFPLLLTVPVATTPSLRACLTRHARWFARMEDLALSVLEPGFSLEAFEAALAATGDAAPPASPLVHPAAADAASVALPALPEHEATSMPAYAMPSQGAQGASHGTSLYASQCVDADLDGQSAWWTDGSAQVAAALTVRPGMPQPGTFSAFLDARWRDEGW